MDAHGESMFEGMERSFPPGGPGGIPYLGRPLYVVKGKPTIGILCPTLLYDNWQGICYLPSCTGTYIQGLT